MKSTLERKEKKTFKIGNFVFTLMELFFVCSNSHSSVSEPQEAAASVLKIPKNLVAGGPPNGYNSRPFSMPPTRR